MTRNLGDRHWTTGLHADVGWALAPTSRLALLSALQLGGTLSFPDDGEPELREHLAVEVAVGWWF